MGAKQGFKSLKFKTRAGVTVHDADWIAGVDYEDYNNFNDDTIENENDDDDYEYQTDEEEQDDEDEEEQDDEE